MLQPNAEWDPSWDDDWQTAQRQLQEHVEEQAPQNPEKAIELYRYGFTAARQTPLPVWSDVESDLYQDYMSEEPGQVEVQPEDLTWEQSRDWAHRGWEASGRHK